MCFFFFKQKTAYEMRISDWSSDVCSSDLAGPAERHHRFQGAKYRRRDARLDRLPFDLDPRLGIVLRLGQAGIDEAEGDVVHAHLQPPPFLGKRLGHAGEGGLGRRIIDLPRPEERTVEKECDSPGRLRRWPVHYKNK